MTIKASKHLSRITTMRYKFSKLHLLALVVSFAAGLSAFQISRAMTSLYNRETDVSLTLIAPLINQENDEADVYRALLRHSCGEQPFVVKDTTERWWDTETETRDIESIKLAAGAHSETITNYIASNQVEKRLTEEGLGVNCPLVSSSTYRSFFDETGRGWRDFYKTYPKTAGALSVSRVGFNDSHNEAIVYVATQCDWLCGHGEFTFLKKEGAVWRIKSSFPLWES